MSHLRSQTQPKAPRRATLPTAPLNLPQSPEFQTANTSAVTTNQFNVPTLSIENTELPVQRSCTTHDCPLVQAGIEHNEGLFKDGGMDQGSRFSILFGASNPPGFIWEADDARREARSKIQKGENVEENEMIEQQKALFVSKFCEYHSS
ncbi:hypothetical protein GLAREA_02613 [Glarea lozoyensis ATCC 20868]|uniref:Uncharacterized protein n=1 Tax=Glarea lozoyensis (strain ATCC 20868 / MF5171) TaxID=1116229 RepID=S3CLW5_GLAL2|nr:uncharacterized protein GLAREA_02613 [Glarea lozoyensis ATCC 20868]EPE26700.1 hypothetical protein GLAREA_02613 [Glarea lozoyensis ATCC 20868]